MNEAGLVANLLWLAESAYPEWDGSTPGLSIAAWVQYILDTCATVDEAVAEMESGRFEVVSGMMPDGSRMATLHLSVSDAAGDSAIFEYVDGALSVHHSPAYRVMTNSPLFDRQLALDDYWQNIGGLTFLPGTNRAADRFVRASFYVDALPQTADTRQAVAGIFSVIRNVSVPLGISVPDQPNISSTRLADGVRPEEQGVLFRIHALSQYFLGGYEGCGFFGGGAGQDARPGGRPDLCR